MSNKTEYNDEIYKISDNIETAENKRIAVFSSNFEISRDLSKLNKAIVIKHNMLDMIPALINEHGEIEIVASFSLAEDESAAIYCNDKLLSDFMSAFMRMYKLRAYCNPLDNPFLKEDLGKKLIHIDIPDSHKNKLTMFIDGMTSFLNGNLYLFNKRLYASREEWERDLSLTLRSMLSNIRGMFKTITPEGINSAVNFTLAKVDPKHASRALSVAKSVVGDIKGKVEVADKKAEMEITKERKLLKAEKTSIQKRMLSTEKALHELQEERELTVNKRTQLEMKIQQLEASRIELDARKGELENTLAEFKGLKAKYKEEQRELNKTLDAVKNERHDTKTEMLQLQRLKEELEKGGRGILKKRSEAEKMAIKLGEEKSWIDKEKQRLEEVLSKLEKEKAEISAKKAELKGLRERVILKRRIKTKLRTSKHVKQKKIRKLYKRLKQPVLKPKPKKMFTPKPIEEPKPLSFSPSVQRIGFYKLKSKLDRHEPVHKRKRLGAWILERKKSD